VYLAALGPHGLAEVAELCLQKAHTAARRVAQQGRCPLAWSTPFFKEFVVRDRRGQVDQLLRHGRSLGILAGLPLGRWYGDLDDCLLIAVTEKRTATQIDKLAECLSDGSSSETTTDA
jgi:glycine dehydrogenase subunit 1